MQAYTYTDTLIKLSHSPSKMAIQEQKYLQLEANELLLKCIKL